MRRKICYPPVINDALVGLFDGAEKDGMCGAGMVIHLDLNHSFWLRMDVGRGTNTIFKLLALWGLLYFANKRHISRMYVYGDLKVIADWDLGIHTIHSIELLHWLGRVKGPFCSFYTLHFHHVYREDNSLADGLSKQAIGLGGGKMFWEEKLEGCTMDLGILSFH